MGGHCQREVAPDAAAGARDDDGFTFEKLQSRKPG
jgi:hypothetical protein